jgi:hypothetical protein
LILLCSPATAPPYFPNLFYRGIWHCHIIIPSAVPHVAVAPAAVDGWALLQTSKPAAAAAIYSESEDASDYEELMEV